MYTKALHGRWCSYVHFTGRKLEDWAAQEADSRWGRVCQPLPRGHSRDQHPWKEGRRERREGVGVNHDRGGVMGSLEGQYLWPGLWGRTAGLESRLCG